MAPGRDREWESVQKCSAFPSSRYEWLIEAHAECQSLKAVWQARGVQALIEHHTECQFLQAAWEHHVVQRLIEIQAKC